jgi:hypothetical protein
LAGRRAHPTSIARDQLGAPRPEQRFPWLSWSGTPGCAGATGGPPLRGNEPLSSLIDFALSAQRNEGKSPREAIQEACLLRFRPIMMTTFSALFGSLPIALGQGAGSDLRQPMGIAFIGGLLVSQWLTLYTTPVIYLYLDRFAAWVGGTSRQPRLAEVLGGASRVDGAE